MTYFDPFVHPTLPKRMAGVFLGPDRKRAAKVNFLWSLGGGREARGYGKSAYLMWMARAINADLGAEFISMAGATSSTEKVVAAYTSFSTIDALSLSGALYGATVDLICTFGNVLMNLRKGHAPSVFRPAARRFAKEASEEVDRGLLELLLYDTPEDWPVVFGNHKLWHHQRYGRRLFGSVVAFLRAVDVTRVLLLIDQMEDFAGLWPSGKHFRDFSRMGEMCVDDPLFKDTLQIVLTQHPRAQFVMDVCWSKDKLGELPAPTDETRCIIIPAMQPDQLERLVTTYLRTVRVTSIDGVAPFTKQAIVRLARLSGGRPGVAVEKLHHLIELAVDRDVTQIDTPFVEELFE